VASRQSLDLREPPIWSGSSHTPHAMRLVQIGALCIVARGETLFER
jgi:hypothetical protein